MSELLRDLKTKISYSTAEIPPYSRDGWESGELWRLRLFLRDIPDGSCCEHSGYFRAIRLIFDGFQSNIAYGSESGHLEECLKMGGNLLR